MLGELNDFKQPVKVDLNQMDIENKNSSKKQGQWSPYELNGGNMLAFAQDDYVIFGADKRMSRGYMILHRNMSKIHKLTDETYILSAGMNADAKNLWKKLDQKIELYQLNHGCIPSSRAVAQLLSRTLYEKRFFPFYTFNLIVGNENGESKIWTYDAIGSYDTAKFSCQGNGKQFMGPLIDNQFQQYNNIKKTPKKNPEELLEILVDVFTSVAERDITCGDRVEFFILKKDKLVLSKEFPLRSD